MNALLRVGAVLLSVFSLPSFASAAIAYASNSGVASQTSSTGTTCSITATNNFTSGNFLVVFVSVRTTTSTISTITAGSNNLTLYAAINNSTNIRNEVWVDTSYSGGTSKAVTVTASAGTKMVCGVVEYSGVGLVGRRAQATGSGANPTAVAIPTQDNNNFMIAGLAGQGTGTFTNGTGCGTTSGTLRTSGATATNAAATNAGLAICEQSVAVSGTSPSMQVTNADTIWQSIAVELRSVTTSGVSQLFRRNTTGTSGGAATTVDVLAGDVFIACARSVTSEADLSVSDTAGSSYSVLFPVVNNPTNGSYACWVTGVLGAMATNTVTCTAPSNGTAALECIVHEFNLLSAADASTTATVGATITVSPSYGSGVAFVEANGAPTTGYSCFQGDAFYCWKIYGSCSDLSATASGQQGLGILKATGASACTAATPTFSPVAGTYGSTQSVTIATVTTTLTPTTGIVLCYTTNGTTPAATSPGTCSTGTTYSGAISVASTETINAIATRSGGILNSTMGSALYTISAGARAPTLPILGVGLN